MNRTTRTRSLTARSTRRLAAGLATMAMAFGYAALGLTGTVPAGARPRQAAPRSPPTGSR